MYSGTRNTFFLVYLDPNRDIPKQKHRCVLAKPREGVGELADNSNNKNPFHCFCKVVLTYATCTHTKNQPSFQGNCLEIHGYLKSNDCLPAYNLHLTLSTWITISERTFRTTVSEQSFRGKCSLRQHRMICT